MIDKMFWTFVSAMVFYAGWQTAKKIGPYVSGFVDECVKEVQEASKEETK